MKLPSQCPRCGKPWSWHLVPPLPFYTCPECKRAFDLSVSPPRELDGGQSSDDRFFDPTDPAGILTLFPPEDDGL